MDDTERQYKLQISLGNFGQDEADRIAMGFRNPNAVSTGLRLSYDDDEHNSSITSASGSMTSLPIMMSISDDLRAEIDRQNEEFDNYIKIQVRIFTTTLYIWAAGKFCCMCREMNCSS